MFKVQWFKPDEFKCKCGSCGMYMVQSELIVRLELLRQVWGRPIYVTSGVRCSVHNHKVGGSKTSRHMVGCAADLSVTGAGVDLSEWARFKSLATQMFPVTNGCEFKDGGRYVHVAVARGRPSFMWDGGDIIAFDVTAV